MKIQGVAGKNVWLYHMGFKARQRSLCWLRRAKERECQRRLLKVIKVKDANVGFGVGHGL